ncbi:MAG: serine/threonine-protein kinase [Sandaracinaceae bacterium]
MGEASPSLGVAETPLAPRLPLRLGRFTLCEELGAGGMATVYLARMDLAAGLERLVALKTIHPHLAKESVFVDMFLDEARIASHVTHPNVCSTHDFGEVNGVYYLAMEYLLGEPLFDVINRMVERFDEMKDVLPYVAARIIADASEGVHAAHSARGPSGEMLHIVHRDVSPQNLFVTYDGSVKVVDFGCAKAAERVAHTSTGVMKGKVGYASPEQIKSKPVDARADVWALGVCLWEALTLSPLFSRDTAVSTAMAVLEDPIELASEGRPWVPKELAQIADRALQRKLDRRTNSARELSRELRRFIADSGYTLESAELAEWMDFLFGERHREKIELSTRIQEMDLSNHDAIPLYEVTEADVELLDSVPALEAVRIDDDEDAIAPPEVSAKVRVPAVSSPPEPRKRARWPWLLLALCALAAGGYYLQLYYEPAPWLLELLRMESPEPESTSVDPPTGRPDHHHRRGGGSEGVGDTGERETAGADGETAGSEGASESASDVATEAAETAGETTTPANAEAGATSPASATPERGEAAAESGRRRSRRSGDTVTTVVSGGGSTTYEPVPTPAPRVGTGSVRVVASGGWAEVWAGGRNLGRTPVTAELPVGIHQLRILPYGHEPAQTAEVDIEAALQEVLRITVTPE